VKEIIIRLGDGTIQDGFNHVNVELKSANTTQWEDRSKLAPNPELQQLLNHWQVIYPAAIQTLSPGLTQSPVFDTDTITNVSSQDLVELNYNFRTAINHWLNLGEFRKIDRRLRTDLNVADRIVVIVVSEQLQIWRLPWHFWDLFDDYHHAVEVFCKPRFTDVSQIKPQPNGKVDILTLAGRDPQLNLNTDFLKALPKASIQTLETTSAFDLAEKLNQDTPWDIFIFNGHGNTIDHRSGQDGVIYLDNDCPIEISRLKLEIQKAVERGLQIAIFNCCNGLGLAQQLSDIHIPYLIVMREIIPNQCAQDFLKQVLTRYSQGNSFPAAFKQARQSLRLSSGGFAQFADWLPILFHNPLSDWALPTLRERVTWRNLSVSRLRSLVPDRVVAGCRYLTQPNHRTSIVLGLSSLVSILALNFQSKPQLVAWENAIVDRLQSTQFQILAKPSSKVTIVNYDDAIVLPGSIISHDSKINELIAQIEEKSKPIAWSIGFNIANKSTVFNDRIFTGCVDKPTSNLTPRNVFHINRCDRELISSVLDKYGISQPIVKDFKLNTNLLGERQPQIDRVNTSTITKYSTAQLKKIFDGRIILVGSLNLPEINSLTREAMAIDQIIRSKDPQQSIPLLIDRSISEQFLWIFVWSNLMGLVAWQRHWKLLFSATILSEIMLTGICFMFGQGLPIIVTSIAMISVGGTIRVLTIGADSAQHLTDLGTASLLD
jgi:hypothetical protein